VVVDYSAATTFEASLLSGAAITAVTVAAIGAVATFVVGLLNYRSQRQLLRWQNDFRAREMELTRAAQATDRFARAIEQLGSESPHVRMGGIFAWKRMARDPSYESEYIVDTLAAFIRGRLPASTVGDGGYVQILQLRAPDAQAAVTVLCRSPLSDERVKLGRVGMLDLSRTDLRRANLRDARLDGVSLWGARLEGADLRGAHMENSILEHANFGRFDHGNETFRHGADLSYANLTGASIENAYHIEAALTEGTIGLREQV